MRKVLSILSLCTWMILPLQAHGVAVITGDVILGLALLVGVPLLIVGIIIYFIVKKNKMWHLD